MKKNIPEVTAYRLEEAGNILTSMGISFFVSETVSPILSKSKPGIDREKTTRYRVLKQTMLASGILELVVAKEIF